MLRLNFFWGLLMMPKLSQAVRNSECSSLSKVESTYLGVLIVLQPWCKVRLTESAGRPPSLTWWRLRAAECAPQASPGPPDRFYARIRPNSSVATVMASSRHPSPRPLCLPHRRHRDSQPGPPSGLRPLAWSECRFAHIHSRWVLPSPAPAAGVALALRPRAPRPKV